MKNKPRPISNKKEVRDNPDKKIDQDFKGYPHGQAKVEVINPKTEEEKKIADLDNKDGEKRVYKKNKKS